MSEAKIFSIVSLGVVATVVHTGSNLGGHFHGFHFRSSKSKGFDTILVIVDRLSKYAHFILLKHPYMAKKVATIFAKEIVRLHGMPHSTLSDKDPLFVSIF